MTKTGLTMGLLALGLAACGDANAPQDAGTDSARANRGIEAGATTGGDDSTDEMQATIPSALRGRWGMNPRDCDPARSDAKGLLTIGDSTLKFYESVGTLTKSAERDASRLRGTFAFTGEGMAWQRDVDLSAPEGDGVLIRRDYDDGAASVPFRYERCAS